MAIDYRSFSNDGSQTKSNPTANQKRWWTLKGSARADAAASVLYLIYENDSRRQTGYQTGARLYGNTNMLGLLAGGHRPAGSAAKAQGSNERLTYNVVQSCVDTITAKIAKNKPRPLFLTSGGDYRLQTKAKKLQRFVDGIFYENKAYSLGNDAFRDSGVFGDGLIHIFEHDSRIKYERAFAGELYVDYMEARYGDPRQLHRVKSVDRDVLMALFPDKKAAIEMAPAAKDPGNKLSLISDQVNVCESWHLKSGSKATDGVHIIWLEGEELFEEEWTYDYFPFAKLPWSKRMDGYWSQGAAEQLSGIQLEINKLLAVVQRSYHLAGSFKVFLENGSKIVKEHLNNDVGAIINYTGTIPQYVTTPVVPPEIYNWLVKLKADAFEQVGVSMLSATAQKPAGLDSGKALREYNDIESDRFQIIGQRYEQLFLDLAAITIDMARKVYEREGKYEVTVPGKQFIEKIDWSDVDMDNDSFTLQAFPTSSFANTPAGRLGDVKDLSQAGFISPRTAKRLMDFPDLEAVEGVENSPEEYLKEILDKMLYEGETTAPEGYDDLTLAKQLALEYYAMGKRSGVEEEKLEMLRVFMSQVDELVAKAQPPPMPGAGGPPAGGAQAVPQAPPVSDLMQNAPGGGQ